MKKKKVSGAIFLDLAKAFDCVDYQILLSKLPFYGIVGKELDWFRSYLSSRAQCVRLDNDASSWGNVSIGVPQGSILGPLLFTIYVNDLPLVIQESDINMYADDTAIHASASTPTSVEQTLQLDLDRVADWMKINRLKLNTDKTVSMLTL